MKPTVLFVDDEPSLCETVPLILRASGFDVTAVATVAEALKLIAEKPFDILVSDLNIGEPNDGLLLVSAMRRTQPAAATVIVTGYPGFESALRAIQVQVDDYLIKPAHPEKLVETLRRVHDTRPLRQRAPLVRLFDILREKRNEVLQQWLSDVEASPDAHKFRMSREERLGSLPRMLDAVIDLGCRDVDEVILTAGNIIMAISSPAKALGVSRREQGYWATLLTDEVRLLEKIILRIVEQNLIRIDLGSLFRDLQTLNDLLGILLRESIRSFLDEPVALA